MLATIFYSTALVVCVLSQGQVFDKGPALGGGYEGIEVGKGIGGGYEGIGVGKGIGGGYEGIGVGKGIGGGYEGIGNPGWEGHPGYGKPLVNVIKKQELIYNPVIKKVPFKLQQPVVKLPAYKPKFDITPFLKPAEVVVDQYVPPVQKFVAPPKYITNPTHYKEVIQDVFIKQPIQVTKIQRIHKKEQVNVIKGPAVVEEEKVPVVDVKPGIIKGVGEVDIKPELPIAAKTP